ncbi:hypothetical protein MBLNU457_6616t1 [Dothideomycetes sp. NU457]
MAVPITNHLLDPIDEQRIAAQNDFPKRLIGKKILLATESLGPVNGVSRTTQQLISYLRAHDVHVATVAPKVTDTQSDGWSKNGDPDIRVTGWPLPYSPDLSVAYPFRLDNICRRTGEPDLIYLASPASVGFQFLLQVRQLESPAAVVLNFQTDLSAYSQIMLPPPLDDFGVWLLRIVQGFLFKHWAVDTIFYPSKGVKDYIVKSGAPADKCVHLGRGVDTELFAPSKRSNKWRQEIAPNGELILMSVGRVALEKGFPFLSQVVQKLVDSGLDFKMVVVGGNKSPAVEKKVHDLFEKNKGRVVFLGFRTGEALAECYASADMFLHCSVTETFGLVVLEAMASGIPVVARDEGGPSEIVLHEKTGYLVPPKDLDGFVGCVECIAKDDQLRYDFAVASRVKALDTTWDKINNKVAWQLDQALDKAEKRRGLPNTPIRNWILSHPITSVSSAIVLLKLNACIGIVCFFWLIAVVPLIVHGSSLSASLSSQVKKMDTRSSLGNGVSGFLKQQKH